MMKRLAPPCLALLLALSPSPVAAQPSPAELSATHGYVYVDFPVSRGREVLTLKSVESGKRYVLEQRSDPGIKASGGWLPAGTYKIAAWSASDLKDYDWGDYDEITVKPGQLTDLGGIIAFPLGLYEFVGLPVRTPETAAHLQRPLAEQKEALHGEVIAWTPKAPPKPLRYHYQASQFGLLTDLLLSYGADKQHPEVSAELRKAATIADFFALAKASRPPQTSEPAADADGRLYYGAELGQLRVRAPAGTWSAVDTGVLATVTAIDIAGRHFLAGYEDGTLRESRDGGATWQPVAVQLPGEIVKDIDRVGDRWLVVSVLPTRGNNLVRVYQADSALAALTRLTESPLKSNNWEPVIRGEAASGAYYVVAFPNLLKLDLASGQWTTVNPPADTTFFHAAPSGDVLAAFKAQGILSKLHLSLDGGATWQKYKAPPLQVMDVYFRDADHGTATRSKPNALSATLEVLEYDRASDSWTTVASAPNPTCATLLRDTDFRYRFCVTHGGSLIGLDDGKWRLEYRVD